MSVSPPKLNHISNYSTGSCIGWRLIHLVIHRINNFWRLEINIPFVRKKLEARTVYYQAIFSGTYIRGNPIDADLTVSGVVRVFKVQIVRHTSESRQGWKPPYTLSYRRSAHPFKLAISQSSQEAIQKLAQDHPASILLCHTYYPNITLTSQCFRDLLTHNSLKGDNGIVLFLEIFCTYHSITYLSPYFLTVLQRDNSWASVTKWFAKESNICSTDAPLESREPSVLIPCHVNGNH